MRYLIDRLKADWACCIAKGPFMTGFCQPYKLTCSPSRNLSLLPLPALDARLEVGLEQQAELMLKMMATLQADSILQALTSTSPTGQGRQKFSIGYHRSNGHISKL